MVLVAGRFGAPLNGEQALGEWAVEVNGPWDSVLPERSHDLGKHGNTHDEREVMSGRRKAHTSKLGQ